MGQQNQGNDLLKGALLGGLLGGAAALLLAPKSGKELRDDIGDTYQSITEKAQDFTENCKQAGHKCLHPFEQEEECNTSPFLIGGAVGAVIGVVAALMLAPQSGGELREALGDKYDKIREKAEDYAATINAKGHAAVEQVGDWKDTLSSIIQKLSNKKGKGLHIDEILDWAGLGMSLLQQLQKRR